MPESLKGPEGDGLVTRTQYMKVPVRVKYQTTDKVKPLTPILVQLAQWAVRTDA